VSPDNNSADLEPEHNSSTNSEATHYMGSSQPTLKQPKMIHTVSPLPYIPTKKQQATFLTSSEFIKNIRKWEDPK